jgi:hypothetical protein
MARISDARKAERLNYAWRLLQRGDDLGEAVERMARDCAISARQAYSYLEQARGLKGPVAVSDEKIAFTVKLRRGLVRQVRDYARARALVAQRVGRLSVAQIAGAEMTRWRQGQLDATRFSWSIALIVYSPSNSNRSISCWYRTSAGRSGFRRQPTANLRSE